MVSPLALWSRRKAAVFNELEEGRAARRFPRVARMRLWKHRGTSSVDVFPSRELMGPFAVAVVVNLLGLPSFGSLAGFPCQQVAELGMGLADSGVNFVWVVNDKNTLA
ncbi:hypothetical protein E2562_009836 [Oryza meyeriana var. granulata]|uniref:Uncharacterized protein n=1 Tax=Oryza meyeriana var. granulata TaxID=110450 RepID=A0A6G1BUI2_9ORYZ|nr:hypothetical protein E2562_009836 [Oryza meyeriana var. granulata]